MRVREFDVTALETESRRELLYWNFMRTCYWILTESVEDNSVF